MSKVDDELTRRLHRAERPVDGDGLFDGLERRRSHRERLRKVQAALLTFAVLAATAGGFVALQQAFDGNGRTAGETPLRPLSANGEIVFSREGADGRSHLFAVQPNGSGSRQITDDATNDTQPAISPDGQTIAYVHRIDQGSGVIATVPVDGGTITWQTEEGAHQGVSDPAWSPDGSQLVFVGSTVDSAALFAGDVDRGKIQQLPQPAELEQWPAHPTWSPDGTRIAFAALDFTRAYTSSDLGVVHPDGTGLEWLLASSDAEEEAPSWSPDGTRIAFLRPGDGGHEVWTIAPNGTSRTLVATAAGALEPDLAWAPDGSALLVSDGVWIYLVDATPAVDPRDNFDQLVKGSSPTWQPLPAGSEPSPRVTPEPSISPEPEPERDDLGFGFDVCEVSQVRAQFDGVDATDTAFVATEREGSGCPSVQSASAHVGIDLDEDGLVDATYGPIACEVYYCRAFAAPDLDGDDGKRELLVVESAGSIVGLGVYALGPEAESPGSTEVVRIHIGEPGPARTGFVTGEPARLFIGGDEGWSYRLRCEDHGVNRFLYQQRAFRPVDSTGPATVDETTLIYFQRRLDVFDAREPEPSTSDDPLGPQPADVCGAPIPAV